MNNCKISRPKRLRSSRRANHTGTTWCQKGIWYGKMVFKGQLFRTPGFKSRSKAESALNKLAAKIARQKACKTTLAEWADEWLKACAHKNAYNTYYNYERAVNHARRYIGSIRLTEITAHDVTKLYTSLVEEGLKPSTVSLVASAMTALSRYAVLCKKIDTDFTTGAIKPRKEKRTYRVFTEQEAAEFIRLLERERLKFPLLFMLLLGVRRGEAMAVKWEKIDLDSKIIVIDAQAVTERGARVLKSPKTDSSIRTIGMPDILIRKLQEVPGRERRSYPYEFAKLYPDALSRDFKRIVKQMGIENMRLYDLRHTFASMLTYRGVSAKEVADHLGHCSDKIVNNIYVHKSPHQASMCAKVANEVYSELLRLTMEQCKNQGVKHV